MSGWHDIEAHPLANVFPMLEVGDFEALCKSIASDGLDNPIVMHEELILDGRNRYNACLAMNVEPTFEQFDGDDARSYVIRQNVLRRHLNASQRAIIAAVPQSI